MGKIAITTALAAVLLLVGCSKPEATASAQPAVPTAPAKAKCPDPSIKDHTNPCSPYYYKPVQGSFKNQKSF